MNKIPPVHWTKHVFWAFLVPATALAFGAWLDRKEDLRMTRFRDKSALFGRELKPGEQPSWP